MLRTHYILALIMGSCIVSGCDKDGHPRPPYTPHAAVSTLTTSLSGTEGTSSWSSGDIIGISAYRAGSASLHASFGHKAYRTTNGLTFSPLNPENKIFYPADGTALDLVAFYPYKPLVREHEYEIDIRKQNSPKDIDLLYSANAKNQDRHAESSHLIFKHALSKLVIETKPGTGLSANDLVGMSLSLSDVYTQGRFWLPDGSLLPQGTSGSLDMHANGLCHQAILLPGAFAAARLHISLASGETFEGPLPELNLLAGTRYHYVVNVHKTHITLQPSDIAPWEGIESMPGEGDTDEISYKEGDYYPNPNDPRTAIGVVYWLVPGSGGISGRILSFDSSEQAWSTNASYAVLANSITRGIVNMEKVMMEDFSLQLFPAFLWCYQKGHGWYLPARHELHILREQWENHASINTALVLADGEPLSHSDSYWCSSESISEPEGKAETYTFANKGWPSLEKTTKHRVRAILLF
jgi:hypothetical protein